MNWNRRIFLAHASEDKGLIRDLYQKLKDHGIDPWLDEKDIDPGDDWDAKIREAINKCRLFLACFSSKSVSKRGYVQRELRMALSIAEEIPLGTTYLIPCLVEDIELPEIAVGTINLSSYQYVRLYNENDFLKLTKSVKEIMGLTQERITEEARAILQDVGLGILDKVNQFINEVSALNTLAIDCFKTGGYEMAENHLLTALKIDKDNTDTLLNLGRLYKNANWQGHNPVSAFDMFQRASDAGSVKAKTDLGHCYQEGTGTNIDHTRAHGLLREAAEAGDPPAMSLLGLSYLAGQGVQEDKARGIELITRGAELGDMEAQSTLSMVYSSGGLGVVGNKKKALEWAIKAAAQGDVPSMEYINEVTNDARSRFK